MPDIRHRVVMSAPLDRVYSAIATKEGLSDWWTRDGVRGDSKEGSTSSSTSASRSRRPSWRSLDWIPMGT